MAVINRAVMPVHPRKYGSYELDKRSYFINVEYNEIRSERRTLVLLHGYLGNTRDYQPAFDALTDRFNLIAIDHRAHGESQVPEGEGIGWSMGDLAFDIYQVIDKMTPEGDKFSIMASSMSTAVSMELARMYPERVEQLFLMSTTYKFKIPGWSRIILGLGRLSQIKIFDLIIEGLATFVSKLLGEFDNFQDGIDRFQHIDIEFHEKILNETLKPWEAVIDDINVPVLILAGSEDSVIPIEDSLELAEKLPNASHILFQGEGHHIIRAKINQIYDLVEQWLDYPNEILENKFYLDTDIELIDGKHRLIGQDTLVTTPEIAET